ncbi:MAG: tetratricopeptide repeat protein [Nitrospirae bacterium]|jgi:tetratricopeptide (TPR) repeat protein|nr:tetratricopeptide repeat protein [Nitrospirota bacterium]
MKAIQNSKKDIFYILIIISFITKIMQILNKNLFYKNSTYYETKSRVSFKMSEAHSSAFSLKPSAFFNFRSIHVISTAFFGLIISGMFLTSCSFPRFLVLDDPLTPEEHLSLGVAYEKKGEFGNALKEYEAASKKLPVAYLYMGNVYFQKHNYEEAEYYYKKAIKKDPSNSDAYNNLAWMYFLINKNIDEAEKLALKAIELNPSKMQLYLDTLNKIQELKRQKKIE